MAAMLLVFLTSSPTAPYVAHSALGERHDVAAPAADVSVVKPDVPVTVAAPGAAIAPDAASPAGHASIGRTIDPSATLPSDPPSDISDGSSVRAEADGAVAAVSPGASNDVDPFQPSKPPIESSPITGTLKTNKRSSAARSYSLSFGVTGSGWDEGSKLNISLDRGYGNPVFAQAGGPFVAIGEEVYSTTSGEAVGRTGPAFGTRPLKALSADGKYFAIGDDDGIEVRNCEAGAMAAKLSGKSDGIRLELLSFGGPDRLFAVTTNKGGHYLQSWNLANKKLSKDVLLAMFDRQATLSADGKLLATPVINSGVLVYDIQRSPSKGKAKIAARIPIKPQTERGLMMIDGLRFSPNGAELIALCNRSERLLAWDRAGRVVFEQEGGLNVESVRSFQRPDAAIVWEPGGRGWLLQGAVFFDRRAGKVTWLIEEDSVRATWEVPHRFLDDERLAVCRTFGTEAELVDIKIPWKRIEQSLEAMRLDD
ncbi:MAG: hypothetical protein ACREJM_11915, partial [Candidatus Saccharimonadales bacterium]